MNSMTDRLSDLESNRLSVDQLLSTPIANDSLSEGNNTQAMKASNFLDSQSLKKWSVKEDTIFAFWNCQGLRTAYPTLCNILSDMQETPLVIGLCETFVSNRDNFSVWDFQFPGYVSERKERQVMERGGLALLIKEGVSYWVREDLSLWLEGRLETLFIEIENKSDKNVVVGLVYKTPSFNEDVFIEEMEHLMEKFSNDHKYKVVMGDFNIDLLKSTSRLDFLNSMISSFQYPLVTIPTRVTDKSATLIDNIFVDGKLLESSYADVRLTDGFDHLFLLSKIKKSYRIINKSGQINKTYFRDLRKDNF